MRIFSIVVIIAACAPANSGKRAGAAPDHPFPLPADGEGSAVERRENVGLIGPTSEACIPAGEYRVLWDFGPAKVTGLGGLDEAYCRPMIEGLAQQGLGKMTITHASVLGVGWPGDQRVIERGACSFEITSRAPAVARIVFSGGTGNGIAAFSIATSNHPGERCDVEGATFQLAK